MEKWPNRIREAREARNLTLEQLADRVGISYGEVAKTERGDRDLRVSRLILFARALQCHPTDLLPPEASLSKRTQAFATLFEQLAPEDQDRLFKFCHALLQPSGAFPPEELNK